MSISRRRFLKGGTLGLGALLTGCASTSRRMPAGRDAKARETTAAYDCVIIGAGISGMTAARDLVRAQGTRGPLKVLILEGSGRVGGRIFTNHGATSEFGGQIEMGAEFVHVSEEMAPIWQDIKAYNLETDTLPKVTRGYLYHPEYFPKPQSPVFGKLVFDVIPSKGIFSDIDAYAGHPDLSGDAFVRSRGYTGLANDSAEMIFSGHMPAPYTEISLKGFACDKLSSQLLHSKEYYIIGGYDTLVRAMAEEIGTQNLWLNQTVESVRRADGSRLLAVHTLESGTITSKTVLSTVSIGALHAGRIDFGEFWTREKQESLNFIRAGHHTKVTIRFDRPFWPPDMCLLNYLHRESRKAGKTYFRPFYTKSKNAPILTALIMGDEAAKLRKLSDLEILQVICRDLDTMFFPGRSPTAFKHIARNKDGSAIYLRKQWMDDPWSLGGNSYLRTGEASSVDVCTARHALASSISTKPLFWAGEATETTQQPASVHGAHSSGRRAAREILNFLRAES